MAGARTVQPVNGLFWWHASGPVPERAYAREEAQPGSFEQIADGRAVIRVEGLLRGPGRPSADSGVGALQGQLTDSGNYMLLLEANSAGRTFRNQAPHTEKWMGWRWLTKTAPFRDDGEPSVSEIRMNCDAILEWFGRRLIDVREGEDGVTATLLRPPELIWNTDQGQVELSFPVSRPMEGAYTRAKLEQSANLSFRPNGIIDLETATRLSRQIWDFLTLVSGADPSWPEVHFKSSSDDQWMSFHTHNMAAEKPNFDNLAVLVPFNDIDDLGIWLAAWLAASNTPGSGVVLRSASHRTNSLEYRFITLVWGMEALHRARIRPEPNPRLEKKINRILDQIKASRDRSWVEMQIRRNSEPSLAVRLVEIIANLGLGLDRTELTAFSDRVAGRRNDLSHFGGPRAGQTTEKFYDELLDLIAAVDLLYAAALLQVAGASRAHLEFVFHRSPRSFRRRELLSEAGLNLAAATPLSAAAGV